MFVQVLMILIKFSIVIYVKFDPHYSIMKLMEAPPCLQCYTIMHAKRKKKNSCKILSFEVKG
ncbi:hypothetical protein MA16_Dca019938 [Dendrobium catenatum]|uniref:Uncharacterized protein n=1 Tax=Dendrobium catenatum TaxID=906689 RepID=A0A2I0VN79_9ASPA|nr:hypothetical protein MA16_Dca019937 [Dendrobium catenatum]PKU64861.1 hypothetical protein MA16_Dca019938 [Dendrobium catenatum]